MHLPSVVLVIAICSFQFVAPNMFDQLDENHDGTLDRGEFSTFAHQLQQAIEPFTRTDEMQAASANSFGFQKYLKSISSDQGFTAGALNALAVIIITEIGDKTFFIAAVLAMRNGRLIVYLGCMAALGIMHLLSSLMGYALPSLLPRIYTHYASALLFVYFGVKLLKESMEMEGGGPSEELAEVENELIDKRKDVENEDDEEVGKKSKPSHEIYSTGTFEMNVFTQAFTLTFLAEWGDRSQIATIAIASTKDVYGVILGGIVGHALCTGVAVVGGRMLAARISEKTVALCGGILFLVFAIHSLVMGP